MGIPVFILGESGSGKSTSLRNFEKGEVGIFNIESKPLPFRKKLPVLNTDSYQVIEQCLTNPKNTELKTYVIDDSQYLLAEELFRTVKEVGYSKYTNMAVNFKNLISTIIKKTPPDTIVYLLHHVETDANGKLKAKTIGKMLDTQLTVEGLFAIVLLCVTDGVSHKFITQSDGTTTAKSPMGMFEREIDNDLKMVDKTIRDYYFGKDDEENG